MSQRSALEAEAEYRRCQRDAEYFIRNYVYIKIPGRGKVLFGKVFSEAQADVLRSLVDERYILVLKARQTGFTTIVMAYVLYLALFHPDTNILVLSKREEDAQKNLDKAIYAYTHLPRWLKLRAGDGKAEARKDKGVEKMAFLNDSVIDSLPATGDTGRGESASLVVLDEWAFFPDPDRTWAAIEPTADVGGNIVAISTANGVGNSYHKQWQKATRGESFFVPLFYGWRAMESRDDSWYETKVSSLEDWQLAQEYPSDPDEAFIKSARPYYDVDLLRGWETRKPLRRCEIMADGSWSERIDGALRVYIEPDHDDAYVLGVDTAEGLPHGDFSSIHVISVRTGAVAACWHGRIDPDLLGSRIVYHLGMAYHFALAGVERNSSGLTTVTALNNVAYPNLFFQTYVDRPSQTTQKKFGWSTTKVSRPLMLDELAEAIREESLTCWDKGTQQELMSFVRDDSGKGVGSPHDDRVFSLGIAVQMLKHAHLPEYRSRPAEHWTGAWWDALVRPPADNGFPIVGNHAYRTPR